MLRGLKRSVGRRLQRLGNDWVRSTGHDNSPSDLEAISDLFAFVRPFTMTSRERVFALRSAVEYVIGSEIPGAIVECGVWKGGSMMAVAKTLMEKGTQRTLYLFDTFDGMTEPSDADKDFRGVSATERLRHADRNTSLMWGYSPLDEVKNNIRKTGYDEQLCVFVEGRVEQTIPDRAPPEIALLRLDTDWYESTSHEMQHLFPRLSVGGVLLIDDYGHWQGARKAVDQYLTENEVKLLLHRIDYTGRIGIKLQA